jgi:hypothetical protein
MRRHGVEDWRLSTRRSPGFAERDEHAGPADDGVLRQGHGLPSAGAGRCRAWRPLRRRPAAGRPAPGQVASPGGASLPLVAQQDAAGKARTGGRRPRATRPPSELCMGVPCVSMVSFRSLRTKAPWCGSSPFPDARRPSLPRLRVLPTHRAGSGNRIRNAGQAGATATATAPATTDR